MKEASPAVVHRRRSLPTLVVALIGAGVVGGCADDRPVEPPQILYGEDPIDYPLDLYDQAEEGEVVVRVRVDERGTVDSVEVAESSGSTGLDQAALTSLRTTKFTPARQGEERVRAWVTVPVRFSTRPRPDAGSGT